MLVKEHGSDLDEHRAYRQKVLTRFENPRITDDVARAPIHKLGHDERFASPALRLLDIGYGPVRLASVIGAMLRYDYGEDAEARELQETVRVEGERSALARYAGIEEDRPLVDLVVQADGRGGS